MNQLRSMKTFVRVVDAGSFTAAAAELGLSRAKVSAHISELERHLGVLLLTRTTRSLSMTHDGRAYYTHCMRVFKDIEETEASLKSAQALLRGKIRVDASSGAARNMLLPIIKKFLGRYPEISIELRSSGHIWDVAGVQSDVLIRIGPIPDSSLISRTIYQGKVLTVASPDYIAAYGEPAKPEDLSRHKCIGFLDPISGRELTEWTFQADGASRNVGIASNLVVNDGEVYAAAAIHGFGIAHSQAYTFESYIRDGRLRRILSSWETMGPPMVALYQQSKGLSPRVLKFVDFLASECGRAG